MLATAAQSATTDPALADQLLLVTWIAAMYLLARTAWRQRAHTVEIAGQPQNVGRYTRLEVGLIWIAAAAISTAALGELSSS